MQYHGSYSEHKEITEKKIKRAYHQKLSPVPGKKWFISPPPPVFILNPILKNHRGAHEKKKKPRPRKVKACSQSLSPATIIFFFLKHKHTDQPTSTKIKQNINQPIFSANKQQKKEIPSTNHWTPPSHHTLKSTLVPHLPLKKFSPQVLQEEGSTTKREQKKFHKKVATENSQKPTCQRLNLQPKCQTPPIEQRISYLSIHRPDLLPHQTRTQSLGVQIMPVAL